MKNKLFMLAFLSLVLMTFGCGKDDYYADSTDNTELQVRSDEVKFVPIKAEKIILVDEYDEFGQALGGGMEGIVTHLGKLSPECTYWKIISSDPSGFPIITFENRIVECAANGDMLEGAFYGVIDFTDFSSNGTVVFEGGTGRFENATGSMYNEGYFTLDDYGRLEKVFYKGEGMISY